MLIVVLGQIYKWFWTRVNKLLIHVADTWSPEVEDKPSISDGLGVIFMPVIGRMTNLPFVFQKSRTFKLQDDPSLHIDRVTSKSSVRPFNSCTISSWDGETLRKCSWLTRDFLYHVALLNTCAATLT